MNIDAIYLQGDDQLMNLWEGSFSDDDTSLSDLNLRITNVQIGNRSLDVEQLPTGEYYYVGLTEDKTLSITLRESVRGDVWRAFKAWWDAIYDDEAHSFRTYPNTNRDPIHKTFQVTFLGKSTQSFLESYFAKKKAGVSKLGSTYSSKLSEKVFGGGIPQTDVLPTKTLTFLNCKLLSFYDSIALGYDDGGPLSWNVSMVFDYMTQKELNTSLIS